MNGSDFRLEYRLVGTGWIECDVRCNGQSVTISASYLSDALGQLAAAALLLRLGAPSARVSFEEEPGEYRWAFDYPSKPTREGWKLRVRIWDFDDYKPWRSESENPPIFDELVPVEVFYSTIIDCLDGVLIEHGEAGYLEKWHRYPFPVSTLNELRRLVAEWPGQKQD